jgi:ubiquinone/menaquinone biosynthesis C-methylase UbiE
MLPDNARVLDIGCGPGTLIPFLGDHLGGYVGIDHNPRYIERARGRFRSSLYTFLQADVSTARDRLAERECRFDAIQRRGAPSLE